MTQLIDISLMSISCVAVRNYLIYIVPVFHPKTSIQGPIY